MSACGLSGCGRVMDDVGEISKYVCPPAVDVDAL